MGSVFTRGESIVIEYKLPNGKIKRETIGKTGIVTKTMAKLLKTDSIFDFSPKYPTADIQKKKMYQD